jgi:hypothetical protein
MADTLSFPDGSAERNALLDAREKAQALVRIRPDLRFIGGDIVRLLDAIQKCPGDIFARRQLAERYATIGRRLGNPQ